MKQISSPQNAIFKQLKSLQASTKARREADQTILEGIHLADSFLTAGLLPEYCVVSQSSVSNQEVQQLLDRLDELQIGSLSVSDGQFRQISSVENGVGLALVIKIPAAGQPSELTQNGLLVDDVQDPGNLGTMLRTAAAAGVKQIFCSSGTSSAWSPKVLRAGMGAHFGLEIFEHCDLAKLIPAASVPVFATTLAGGTSIYRADLSKPAAWLVGNEGQGVSAALLENENATELTIPQAKNVESLNVAAATAVCLFEQRRQQLISQE